MSEQEPPTAIQTINYARFSGHVALQMLLMIMPVLTKRGLIGPDGVKAMHDSLLLAERNQTDYSDADRAMLGQLRAQLERASPDVVPHQPG